MAWSYQVGKLFGIPLRVHVAFLLLLVFVTLQQPDAHGLGGIPGALFVLALFACVVIHELAHSLVARRYGIPVQHIILLPIGGVSVMEKMPDKPYQEFNVAIVGPLTSLALGLLIGAAVFATGGGAALLHPFASDGMQFLPRLAWLNMLLAGFNLLPIFPTDGGRVLRAFLALRMDYAQATHTATVIGQGLAVAMAFVGLFIFHDLWLLLIAVFLFMGAASEDTQVRLRRGLDGVPASRAMISEFRALDPDTTLSDAFEYASHSYQHDFPVLDGGALVGLVTRQALITGMQLLGGEHVVSEIMVANLCRVSPTDSLSDVYQELATGACHIAVVTDGAKLLGLVTPESVNQYLIATAYKRTPQAPPQDPGKP